MKQEDYCSFELSKLLDEKGFDEPCFSYYKNDKSVHWLEYRMRKSQTSGRYTMRPYYGLVLQWLREVHHVHIGIIPISGKGYYAAIYDVADFDDYGIISDTECFFHVKEAVEAALKDFLTNLI